MSKILQQNTNVTKFYKALTKTYSVGRNIPKKSIQLPQQADVVIIGKWFFSWFEFEINSNTFIVQSQI